MRRNKIISIMIAMLMAVTLSMPSFAFAQEDNSVPDDSGQNSVGKNINAKTATTSSAEETPSTEFRYSKYNGEVTITKYVGTSAEVVIPKKIEGFPVTRIGKLAFEHCSSLDSIIIPEGVTSIGVAAFLGCSSLSSIIIPEGVTRICEDAFLFCSSLRSITIPNSATSIEGWAFYACSSLNNITIPEGVTSLDRSAFYGCSSLSSITVSKDNEIYSSADGVLFNKNKTSLIMYPEGKIGTPYAIPEGVTSIEFAAFARCSSLSSIIIPEGVTRIGEATFRGCSSLSSITIPEGVTSIGESAFEGCSSLSSITIQKGVTSIGNFAFEDCSSLSSITISEGVTSIGESAFRGCSSLSSITIPEGVTSLDMGVFEGCSSLSNITIPNSVTRIEGLVFEGCSSLSSITVSKDNEMYSSADGVLFNKNKTSLIRYPIGKTDKSYAIPEGVTSIGESAFWSCSNLRSIIIPEGVTSIGWSAFFGCSSLSSITIPEGVTSIGEAAFLGCSSLSSITVSKDNEMYSSADGMLFNKNKTSLIRYPIGKTDKSYAIPEGVTSIGNSAFSGCSILSSITIPEGVTSIGNSAFAGCSSLSSITIPEGVTSIGCSAFEECSSLSSITIPERVRSIEFRAFSNCSSLSNITIPNSVTRIGASAFSGCDKLSKIKMPGSLVYIEEDAFDRTTTLIVYRSSNSHKYAVANNINYEIDENEVKATSLTINKELLEIGVGDSFNLNAEILPKNTSQKWIKWSTDNRDVIELDEDGTVVALEIGEATVTATTAQNLKATCHVTVTHIHDWDKGTVIQNVNCTDDEIIKYVCKSCEKSKEVVITQATGHNYSEEFTADSKAHWKECHCGARTNEEGHNWQAEYRTIEDAKCTEAGSKAIFCEDCGAKKVGSEVELDALGHAYGTVTINPTCSQGGYTLHVCGRCGDTNRDDEKPAKGHSFGSWQTIEDSSCTEEGSEQRKCKECEYTETRGVVKKDHNWETDYTIDKPASCITDGSKSIHCKDCDTVKDSAYIKATGHDYSEWVVIKQPSCKESGLSKRTCSKCNTEETLDLAKRGHDWKEAYTIDVPAKCTKNGFKSIHCRDCDAVKDSKVISATGHNFSDYITDKKASFKSDGIKVSTCSKCSQKRTKAIPKAENPVLSELCYIYDGKEKEPDVTVKNSLGKKLTASVDYDVTYENNKYVGTATATITGIGEYSGTLSKTFKINPPKTAITSLTKSKKAFTVKWTKKTAQVTGYQIMYARNSKFTCSKNTVTVSGGKITSKKISKLSSKKKYYVKVRTYKTVNGVKYYSPWSNYRTVKTK